MLNVYDIRIDQSGTNATSNILGNIVFDSSSAGRIVLETKNIKESPSRLYYTNERVINQINSYGSTAGFYDVIPVHKGGTGISTTYTIGDMLYADGTSSFNKVTPNSNQSIKYLTQYGDGTNAYAPSWQSIQTSGILPFFLYKTGTTSGIGNYYNMISIAPSTSVQTITVSGVTNNQTLASFITPLNSPYRTYIPNGLLQLHLHANKSSGAQTAQLYAQIYKRTTLGVETLIATTALSGALTGTQTEYNLENILNNSVILNLTDRLVLKIKANVSGGGGAPTINLLVEDETYSRLISPVSSVDTSNFVPYVGATQNLLLGNNRLGLGTPTPVGSVEIVGTTSTHEFYQTRYSNDNLTAGYITRKSRGSFTSPSAILSGDTIATFGGRGYGATGFSSINKVSISFFAAENWTDAAQGTYIVFNNTATGTTTRSEIARIDDTSLIINSMSASQFVKTDSNKRLVSQNGINTADINNSQVTYAKIQNVSGNKILGNVGVAGNVEELALTSGLSLSGTTIGITTNGVTNTMIRQSSGVSVVGRSANSTGNVADILASSDGLVLKRVGSTVGFHGIGTADLNNSVVTYAKIQNITANRILGRVGSTGQVQELALSSGLAFSGASIISSGGSSQWTTVDSTHIYYTGYIGVGNGFPSPKTTPLETIHLDNQTNNSAVILFTSGVNTANGTRIGIDGQGNGFFNVRDNNKLDIMTSDIVRISISSAGVINTPSLAKNKLIFVNNSNNLTAIETTSGLSVSGTTLGISNNGVTNTMIRQSSGVSVVGRSVNSTGNVADITAASNGLVLKRVGNTVGFHGVGTADLNNSVVTYAKIQNITANRILGRVTSTGVVQELALSSGLSFSGASLVASGSATPAGSNGSVQFNNSSGLGFDSRFFWNNTTKTLLLGGGGFFSNTILHINGNTNNFIQSNIRNSNAGGSASSDIVATADTGSQTANYIDMGINSSTYNDSAFTISTALDGYLYTNGGNLVLGTQTAAKGIIFHAGGTKTENRIGSASSAGWGIGSSAPNASAILDINSTVKGFGLPAMTKAQRSAISSPKNGLMVYETQSGTAGVMAYVENTWTRLNKITRQYQFSMSGAASNTIGSLAKASDLANTSNNPSGLPTTSSGNPGLNNGGIDPYQTMGNETVRRVRITFAGAGVSQATVGSNPTVRIDIYTIQNSARTLAGTVRIPVSTTGIGVFSDNSQNGFQTAIANNLDIRLGTGAIFGAEFVNESTDNNKIVTIRRIQLAVETEE